jgi:Glycosyl transferase family 11
MIVTRLTGGLANQMFQYAAGKRLALHHQTDLELDVSLYFSAAGPKPDKQWPYGLGCFDMTPTLLKESPLGTQPGSVLGKLRSRVAPPKYHLVKEKYYHFDPMVLDAPDNSFLDGYWQTEKYFKDVSDAIRHDFRFKGQPDEWNQKMSQTIAGTEAISLHVRRGDYVSNASANQFHGTSTLDYYNRAIGAMAGAVKEPHFFVFSDEPGWCKENLILDHTATYVDHNTAEKGYEDLRLMSQCKHHIIANSSFSWWGAWLNPNAKKIVMAPKHWFQDTSINTDDLIPREWTRL